MCNIVAIFGAFLDHTLFLHCSQVFDIGPMLCNHMVLCNSVSEHCLYHQYQKIMLAAYLVDRVGSLQTSFSNNATLIVPFMPLQNIFVSGHQDE